MLTQEKKTFLYTNMFNCGLGFSWDSDTDVMSIVVDDRLNDVYDIVSYRFKRMAYEHCHEVLLINKQRKHSILVSTWYDNVEHESQEDENLFGALDFYSNHDWWHRKEWDYLVNILKQENNVTIGLSQIPVTTPDYNIVTGTFFTSLIKCRKHLYSKQTESKVCLNWKNLPTTGEGVVKR